MEGVLNLAIDAEAKRKELLATAEQNGFGISYYNSQRCDRPDEVKSAIEQVKSHNKQALEAIAQITKMGLPEDAIFSLSGHNIYFPNKEKEKDDLRVEKDIKEKEYKTTKNARIAHAGKEPGWLLGLFTRGAWQNKLKILEEKEKELEDDIKAKDIKINKLYSQISVNLKSGDFQYLKGVENISGTSQEIIKKLEFFAKEETPASVLKLYNEYEAIAQKLTNKK